METTKELEALLVKLELTCEADKQRFKELYISALGPSGTKGFSPSPEEKADPEIRAFRNVFRDHYFRRNPFVILRRPVLSLACAQAETEYKKLSSSFSSTSLSVELAKERDWIVKVNEGRRDAFLKSSMDGAVAEFKSQLSTCYPPTQHNLKYYEEPELQGFCNELKEEIEDAFSDNIEWLVEGPDAPKLLQEELCTKLSLIVKETLEENERNADLVGKFIQAIIKYKGLMTKFFTRILRVSNEMVTIVHVVAKKECEKDPKLAQLLCDPANKLAWESRLKEECHNLEEKWWWWAEGDPFFEEERDSLEFPKIPRVQPSYWLELKMASTKYKNQMSKFICEKLNPLFGGKNNLESYHRQAKRKCEEEPGLAQLLNDPAKKYAWESRINDEYSSLEATWIFKKYNNSIGGALQEEVNTGENKIPNGSAQVQVQDVVTQMTDSQRTSNASICVMYKTERSPYFNSELIFPKGTHFPSPPEFRLLPTATNNNNGKSSSLDVQFLVDVDYGSAESLIRDLRFRRGAQEVGVASNEGLLRLTCYIDSSGVFRANVVNPITGQVVTYEEEVTKHEDMAPPARVPDAVGNNAWKRNGVPAPPSSRKRKVGRME